MDTYSEIIIIGGGLSGLYIGEKLKDKNPLVLETKPTPGGRVSTIYDDRDNVKYEGGPWRIPENHKRVLGLLKQFNIQLSDLKTPSVNTDNKNSKDTYHEDEKLFNSMSTWDVNAYKSGNPLYADYMDLSTGYSGETHAPSSTHPYQTSSQKFFTVDKGLKFLIEKLASRCNVNYNTRVVNVKKENDRYNIYATKRQDNTFVELKITCKTLFICIPPRWAKDWDIVKCWGKAHTKSVVDMPLHHIYACPVPDNLEPFHIVDPENIAAQSISSEYNNRWFQASYTAGRLSLFWDNLKLAGGKYFHNTVVKSFKKMLKKDVEFDPTTIESHHFPHAYHQWRVVPDFDLERSVYRSSMLHPVELPNVYWAGEAFSSYQAWMEGALETSDIVLDIFRNSCDKFREMLPKREPKPEELVVEGRILNVTEWKKVHPGSSMAIDNHLYRKDRDSSKSFMHLQHSDHAWSIINSLTVGFVSELDSIPNCRFIF